MAIKVLSTVHTIDYKACEVEISIVSTSTEEDTETRGQWRTIGEAQVELHLFAYAKND